MEQVAYQVPGEITMAVWRLEGERGFVCGQCRTVKSISIDWQKVHFLHRRCSRRGLNFPLTTLIPHDGSFSVCSVVKQALNNKTDVFHHTNPLSVQLWLDFNIRPWLVGSGCETDSIDQVSETEIPCILILIKKDMQNSNSPALGLKQRQINSRTKRTAGATTKQNKWR